ncbi:FAD binding domain-containing protein [Durotheca rogersii]|uniref:FAD binding domain-containing protein n=1 Tax=Durotheca rogersii TaxID=419775 RepID=UPI00221EF0DC|nr:FAD binding domain-containing protein [Durotheca rogersii]KAI5863033.1 FAD binding domain-containing protein [Durotheca rogersii]
MDGETEHVDVLVVGAGPVGLITAFQLAKFGGASGVRIVEKQAKSMQDAYGRAITLFPRTSEMLDQLGLADDLLQDCFACRDTVAYDARGQEVHGRGWSFMREMKDTFFNFALVLRQKFQEEIFRNAMKNYGVQVEAPVELTAASVDQDVAVADHRVTTVLLNHLDGTYRTVKCKYLIGSDGGRSSVRRLFDIPFDGSTSEDKWVRVDGQVKTDMPKPRTYCSVESPTHGNVLWVALDHGATRIGYAFTGDRAKAYSRFDEAAAVKEAIAAMRPFHIEFERVDWWTIYTVGQRIARSFFAHSCVFLAGDACHTHSSGAAQGMNTGIHDAVNIAWKLSLVLRGLARPEILETYQAERLPNVQRLVQYDKDISRLMTNRLPEDWQGDPGADVNAILGDLMAEAGAFSSGLGISYEVRKTNPLNVDGSFRIPQQLVRPGVRAPDVTLLRPGTFEPTRLMRELPNTACFTVLVFVADGTPAVPEVVYRGVRKSWSFQTLVSKGCLRFVTILPAPASSPYEVLGCEPIGRAYFDQEGRAAYMRYGIEPTAGALVLVRPDGWVGTMVSLGPETVSELELYLRNVFLLV